MKQTLDYILPILFANKDLGNILSYHHRQLRCIQGFKNNQSQKSGFLLDNVNSFLQLFFRNI